MENEDRFLITLDVDSRKYPVKVLRSEEEAYRKAANTINKRINQYRIKHGESRGLIAQDFMAMTAIQVLVENFSLENKNDTMPFEKKITSLIDEMDQYLKK